MSIFQDIAAGGTQVAGDPHISPGPGYTWVPQGTNGGGYWQPPPGTGNPITGEPQFGDPGYKNPYSGFTTDANGNVIADNGSIVPAGYQSPNQSRPWWQIALDPVDLYGATKAAGNTVMQKVVETPPIYETSNKPLNVPTPFGDTPYGTNGSGVQGVSIPGSTSTPIVNQAIDSFTKLGSSALDALKGLAPGGGGGAAPPPGTPSDPSKFGYGNFTPQAQTMAGGYQDLSAYHAMQGAPTLQRTGVDWSGMGSGQQAAPTIGAQQPYPSFGAQYQTGATPPPAATNINQGPGGALDPMAAAQRALYAPPPTGGGGGGGGGTVQSGTYGPPSQQTLGGGPGVVGTPPPTGGYQPSPQPQTPTPAPSIGGTSSSTSQFSNPLFGQSQESRDVQGGVMGGLTSPDLYKTPQEGVEAAGRAAETTALNRAASPDLYKTQEGAQQQQSRGIQGATMASTTAPNLYNTPGAAQQEQGRQQQQGFLNRLSADMNGAAPSLAELQLRRGSDAVVANANALAASAGPQGAAMARRQAMQTAAGQGGKLAADTAELRAKEYAQARGEAGQALTNFRGQDIANQGQGFQNITSTQDRAAQQAIALRTADLQAAGQSYENAIKQAQLEQSGAQGIRSGDLQRLGMDYSNTTNQAQLASQMAIQTRAQDLQALGMSYDNAFKQAQLEADQNKTQASLDMQQRGLNLQGELGYAGMANDVYGQDLASRMHFEDLAAQRYAADRNYQFQQDAMDTARTDKWLGAGLGALGSVFALSDERQKTDIAEADPDELSELFGNLTESTFRYKDEQFGKGFMPGIMAQDLEKSRLGKMLVAETPHGKAIDIRKAIGALMAMGALTEKRFRKMKGKK